LGPAQVGARRVAQAVAIGLGGLERRRIHAIGREDEFVLGAAETQVMIAGPLTDIEESRAPAIQPLQGSVAQPGFGGAPVAGVISGLAAKEERHAAAAGSEEGIAVKAGL
jgi:hypothetical protein